MGAAVGLTVRAVREGPFVRPPSRAPGWCGRPGESPDDARPAGLARATCADGIERLSLVARTDDPGFCVVAPLDRVELDPREIPRMARMALGHALWRRMAERSDAARERLRVHEESRRAVEEEDAG